MSDQPTDRDAAPEQGRVWMLAERGRERELVFAFAFDEELNEAVKELPRRWFDWRRKHWRVPADPRASKAVERAAGALPRSYSPSAEVLSWLSDSDRWRGLVTVLAHEGAGRS